MAEPRYHFTCGHCNADFWSYSFSPTKVCNDCFSHGHHGGGGDCWQCKGENHSTDEGVTTQSDKQEDNQPALQPPELLPCPFCGSKAEIVIKQDTGEYGVFCGLAACCAFYAKFATVERWNARTLVQASMDNSAAIALLDKWLSEPEQADDGSLDRLRRLIDENRLSDRKFWPELSPDSEDSRAPVRDGGVAIVDQMWEALKAACCKNPAEAKLAVFVSEKKFKEALAPFAAIVKETDGNHS